MSDYPGYDYGLTQAADQAKRLGIKEITAIELGVGSGNGLIRLQELAGDLGQKYDMKIHVLGFDMGSGLPEPEDYRDLPYAWKQGDYSMGALGPLLMRCKNDTTTLIIGDVADTLQEKDIQAPIGFISFDLDYYSSTKAILLRLDGFVIDNFLPRAFFYFDDVVGDDLELHCDSVGELLAIKQFNARNIGLRAISPINGLEHKFGKLEPWMACMRVLHIFSHPLYNKYIR